MFTYLFGPRFSHRGERWTPFMHTLFGAARLTEDANAGILGPNSSSFSTNGFAMAFGGGVDLKLTKHVAWRVFQSEFPGHQKLPTVLTVFRNNFRAASGIVFRFGGGPPPPPPNHPPVVTASANPTKVFSGSGDSVVVQAQASDPDNDPLS